MHRSDVQNHVRPVISFDLQASVEYSVECGHSKDSTVSLDSGGHSTWSRTGRGSIVLSIPSAPHRHAPPVHVTCRRARRRACSARWCGDPSHLSSEPRCSATTGRCYLVITPSHESGLSRTTAQRAILTMATLTEAAILTIHRRTSDWIRIVPRWAPTMRPESRRLTRRAIVSIDCHSKYRLP